MDVRRWCTQVHPMFVSAPHYNTATCVGRRTAAKPFNAQRESCFAELVLGAPVIRSANKGLKDNNPCPLQHMHQYPLSVSVLATMACLRYFISPALYSAHTISCKQLPLHILESGRGNELEANILVHRGRLFSRHAGSCGWNKVKGKTLLQLAPPTTFCVGRGWSSQIDYM